MVMPELTEEEIRKRAEEELFKQSVLAEHARYLAVIGQMAANIERMEREGTTGAPPLDSNSPENVGKTQYEIDKEILADYNNRREELVAKNPEVFVTEESPLLLGQENVGGTKWLRMERK